MDGYVSPHAEDRRRQYLPLRGSGRNGPQTPEGVFEVKRKGKTKHPPSADALRTRAEKRIKSRTTGLWLLYNIGSFVLINALLIAIWAISDSESPWFLWALLIWAGALAFHFSGYAIGYRHGAQREKMVEEKAAGYAESRSGAGEISASDTTGSAAGEGPQATAAPPEGKQEP